MRKLTWVGYLLLVFGTVLLSRWIRTEVDNAYARVLVQSYAQKLILLGLGLYAVSREGLWRGRLGISLRKAVVGVSAAAGLFLLWTLVSYWMAPGAVTAGLRAHTPLLWLQTAGALLLVGPTEELFFRGYLQGRFSEGITSRWRLVWTAVWTSAAFSAMHIPTQWGNPGMLETLLVIFGISLVLAAAYWATGNIVFAALVHGLIDVPFGALAFWGPFGIGANIFPVLVLLAIPVVRRLSRPSAPPLAVSP